RDADPGGSGGTVRRRADRGGATRTVRRRAGRRARLPRLLRRRPADAAQGRLTRHWSAPADPTVRSQLDLACDRLETHPKEQPERAAVSWSDRGEHRLAGGYECEAVAEQVRALPAALL